MTTNQISTEIQIWPIDRLIGYAGNPRRNDAAVDRMCGSIREFGCKIPCLVRSDGELNDGQLRLKAARKLGLTDIPVILCDEWTPAQVKAFPIMVNRSARRDAEPTTAIGPDGRLVWLNPPEGCQVGEPIEYSASDKSGEIVRARRELTA